MQPALNSIKNSFTLPNVNFVGAHTGCSCGFPSIVAEEPVGYYDGLLDDDPDTREKDLASVNGLLTLVRDALKSGGEVQLFPVWAGHEAEAPAGTLELFIEDLAPEKLFFIEQFFYRLRSRASAAF